MGTYLIVTFLIMLVLGAPIWAVLSSASFISLAFASNTPLLVISQRMFTAVDSTALLAIPLFMIAGNLMQGGGISRRLINFCDSLLGSVTGGLGMVAILACMFFAAISGSGPATVAAIGGIMIPEMERAGYDRKFSAALMAVAGGIGVVIPPSIPMVNVGIAGSVSISSLFAGGFGPGILIGFCLMMVCWFSAKKYGYGTKGEKKKFSLSNVWKSFREAFWAILMPVIILGGIYGGVFTPTEAAGVSVIYGFIVGFFVYKELRLKEIIPMMLAATKSTAMVMMIIACASGFGWILTSERIPDAIASAIIGLSNNKVVILLIINLFLLFVGCVMETTASIIILTPIFMPIIMALGVNPIHFGVVMVINLAIGMSTPPLGVNLFVGCGISRITIEDIFKPLVPFLIANIVALLVCTFFEPIVMFIPRLMGIG